MIPRTVRVLFLFFLFCTAAGAQQKEQVRIYDPSADAAAELRAAIDRAKAEGKHVLVQVGGNWCSWCVKLEKLFATDEKIGAILRDSYVFVRVNYSKENKNLPVLASLGYPQRFGFPALVVLDADGARLHTQDSGFLEDAGAHSPEKVTTFLRNWTRAALDPAAYGDK